MFFVSSLQVTVVILLLVLQVRPTQGRRRSCAARCANKKTKVFKQSADGKTCKQKCIGNLIFPKRYVPKGYVCGSCPVMDASRYNIQLELSMVPPYAKDAFTKAARRWETVVKGDIPDSNMAGLQNFSTYSQYVPLVVDDLFISPDFIKWDGRGGYVTLTGWEWARADTKLPVIGFMQFDQDDIKNLTDSGLLDIRVLSEMGYVLGLIDSVLFQSKGLEDPSTCQYAVQSNASKEWQNLTGCTNSIPVELEVVGQGSNCTSYYWNQNCLRGELMAGVPRSNDKKLSRMTVGALQDLGYIVDYSAADAFTKEMVNSTCLSTCGGTRRLRNVPNIPENRRLTDGVIREGAIDYAKKVLEENAAKAESLSDLGKEHGLIYVGHEALVVSYEDEYGNLGSVYVTNV